MSTLYPSLEDLKVDHAIQAQARATPRMPAVSQPSVLYPNLAELENYMGLSLSSQEVQQSLLQTPEGCRGLFVQLVQANTPASLVGLRFGDQILQIDGRDCAGWSTAKAHRAVKKTSAEKIVMVVRDRPFQRTVTMHKDSMGHVGFVIKKGKVTSVVKGSSAARNGLLTNHSVCEVNGQNVIGLKDKEVTGILATAGNVVTLTVIPTVIYEHMVKKLSPTLLHHTMDHSIPDV
ncbi:syntenin-2 isoform X5 [Manis pentadactyla]|uniref:syntenin-2 isoform X5 n=1 Tax=Manis pentadactyla TaxID=143292 RepID=UPI00255CEA70|nr:syntenin-2 isoform X5 [Manis pentadactyla]